MRIPSANYAVLPVAAEPSIAGKLPRDSIVTRHESNRIDGNYHPCMALPAPSIAGAGVNFQNAPVKFTSGPNAGLYSSGFGVINPTAGTTGMRSGTFVARMQF